LWYYNEVEKQPDIERALRKTYAFLFVPRLSLLYGVKDLVRPTGFVGLAVADFIEPGVTLRYVQE
jgi:hypothetical protein